MLKLITAQRWLKEVFPEGGVGIKTVEAWVRDGTIFGRIIGKKVFVDADRTALLLDQHTVLSPGQAEGCVTDSGDPVDLIVAAVLKG